MSIAKKNIYDMQWEYRNCIIINKLHTSAYANAHQYILNPLTLLDETKWNRKRNVEDWASKKNTIINNNNYIEPFSLDTVVKWKSDNKNINENRKKMNCETAHGRRKYNCITIPYTIIY